MRRFVKKLFYTVATLAVITAVAWWPVKSYLLDQYGEMAMDGATDMLLMRLGLKDEYVEPIPIAVAEEDDAAQQSIELDDSIVPFRQVGHKLGERALDRNYGIMRGGTIFDANGDGRLDLFLAYNQRTFGKQTTKNGLLTDKKLPAYPNTLFLNQGNDEQGDPIYVSVQDLSAKGNKQHTRDELLIEGKYQPRESVEQAELGIGRIGTGAVSADFNGDGRLDLYVLSGHFGIMLQTAETGMPVYPAPNKKVAIPCI